MPEEAPQPVTPSPTKRLVGATILLLMFATALFGDVFVWAVYGTKFVLSPAFLWVEDGLRSLIGMSFIGFLIFEKGSEHLQNNRWKPFLLGVLMFFFASLPTAKSCALLTRLASVKGIWVLAQPKHLILVLLAMLIFPCKCRAGFILWRLVRRAWEPREARRIVISE